MKTVLIFSIFLSIQGFGAVPASEEPLQLLERIERLNNSSLTLVLQELEDKVSKTSNESTYFEELVKNRTENIINKYGAESEKCFAEYSNQLKELVENSTAKYQLIIDTGNEQIAKNRKLIEQFTDDRDNFEETVVNVLEKCSETGTTHFDFIKCLLKDFKSLKLNATSLISSHRLTTLTIVFDKISFENHIRGAKYTFFIEETKLFSNIENCLNL